MSNFGKRKPPASSSSSSSSSASSSKAASSSNRVLRSARLKSTQAPPPPQVPIEVPIEVLTKGELDRLDEFGDGDRALLLPMAKWDPKKVMSKCCIVTSDALEKKMLLGKSVMGNSGLMRRFKTADGETYIVFWDNFLCDSSLLRSSGAAVGRRLVAFKPSSENPDSIGLMRPDLSVFSRMPLEETLGLARILHIRTNNIELSPPLWTRMQLLAMLECLHRALKSASPAKVKQADVDGGLFRLALYSMDVYTEVQIVVMSDDLRNRHSLFCGVDAEDMKFFAVAVLNVTQELFDKLNTPVASLGLPSFRRGKKREESPPSKSSFDAELLRRDAARRVADFNVSRAFITQEANRAIAAEGELAVKLEGASQNAVNEDLVSGMEALGTTIMTMRKDITELQRKLYCGLNETTQPPSPLSPFKKMTKAMVATVADSISPVRRLFSRPMTPPGALQ